MPAPIAAGAIAAAAGIGAAAQMGSAGAQMAFQHRANLENLDAARDARNWQAYMSNTAYQRSMEDMRAAGLNPILAFSQGGASTPPGQVGSVNSVMNESSAKSMEEAIKQATDLTMALKAAEIEKAGAEADAIREEVNTQKTQQDVNSALALKASMESDVVQTNKDFLLASTGNQHALRNLHSAQAATENVNRQILMIDKVERDMAHVLRKYSIPAQEIDKMISPLKSVIGTIIGGTVAGKGLKFFRDAAGKLIKSPATAATQRAASAPSAPSSLSPLRLLPPSLRPNRASGTNTYKP